MSKAVQCAVSKQPMTQLTESTWYPCKLTITNWFQTNHILYQKTPQPQIMMPSKSKYAAFSIWRIEQTIIQLDSLSFSGPRTECNDAHKYIVSNIVQSWGHTELMSNHDSIPQLSWLSSFQSKLRTSNVRWFDLLLQFLSHVELLHFFHIFLLLLDADLWWSCR